MAGWKRRAVGDLPIYQATTMSWLPGMVQGFTTRRGGVSNFPYDTLNLALHVGDAEDAVKSNRERLVTDLGFADGALATADQVHGSGVGQVTGTEGPAFHASHTDALITDVPGILLLMLYADCVPVYIYDPMRRAVGLVHAGWRGAASNIVAKTVMAMREAYDVVPRQCVAAIGPCIAMDNYEVGVEVADKFRNFGGGQNVGASTAVFPRNEMTGRYFLNLRHVVFMQLLSAGLAADSIAVCDQDTFRNARDFFSYRRDGKKTGRMAAYLGMKVSSRV